MLSEHIVATIHSKRPIGCCNGHEFYLISVNGGYTTECKCGLWCGKWREDKESAIQYFENMIKTWHPKPTKKKHIDSADWKESYPYKRIQEILDDYWLSEPDELKVRVRMDFIKADGQTQSKCITWVNPNYKSTRPLQVISLGEIEPYEPQSDPFWDISDLIKKDN